ncbi:MAG: hypothetical protein P8X42_00875, partial [Calditrichaceae bacterium]
ISAKAKIIPAREWILRKSQDGSIQIVDKDHRKNIIHSVSAYQVERGDFVEFRMNENLANNDLIKKDDLIGRIHSIETERELAELKKQLSEARSYLNMSQTGAKATKINVAEEIVNKLQLQLKNQSEIVERKKKLFQNNIISEEEYQIEKNIEDLYRSELLEARANVTDIKSGAKPEEIDLYQNMVKTTKMEIEHVEELLDKFTLKSPLSGRIYRVFSEDTLLIIGDTMSVAVLPIPANDISKVKIGQQLIINADLNETGIKVTGNIININKTSNYLNNKDNIVITGSLDKATPNVPSNTIMPCIIKTEPLILRNYIFNFIKIIFS